MSGEGGLKSSLGGGGAVSSTSLASVGGKGAGPTAPHNSTQWVMLEFGAVTVIGIKSNFFFS